MQHVNLILSCNGYGGNREMVARLMPDIEGALWFGDDAGGLHRIVPN